MNWTHSDYYRATRHPWSCVLFVLPLLLAYEIGIVYVGAGQSDQLRNGADTWLHWVCTHAGLHQAFWPGALLGILLMGWSWWARRDRPRDLSNVWVGMVLESLLFAFGLWLFGLSLGPCLDILGIPLAVSSQPEPAMQEVVAFLGAGIYEETLFRLMLFSLLFWLFIVGEIPHVTSALLATCISALVFAAAHHIGPAGEQFDGYVFLFRTLAGGYFAVLYRLRGFGIAVGAHAAYDVLVGVLLPGG